MISQLTTTHHTTIINYPQTPTGHALTQPSLLASFPDEASRTRGFHVLSELALSLVRAQTGQSMDELVQELSVHLAQAAQLLPPPQVDPLPAQRGIMDS